MTEILTKDAATPAMQQYFALKAEHKDVLLFYRMGDFYELFFEDAIEAAPILDVALTRRGQHKGEDIPMCGVPYHSVEPYIARLLSAGKRVAICEQMETPEQAKKRGHKSVVRREVVRVMTPGTVTEEALLDATATSYILAIARVKKDYALAWADITSGAFHVAPTSPEGLAADLYRLQPKEILVPEGLLGDKLLWEILKPLKAKLYPHVDSYFSPEKGGRVCQRFYEVANLESWGALTSQEIAAAGAVIDYIETTQRGQKPRMQVPVRMLASHFMMMDAATRRNLEITQALSGGVRGSLFSILNQTRTSAGTRLLGHILHTPLIDAHAINQRLDAVGYFVHNEAMRQSLRDHLAMVPDIERICSRLYMRRGGPRDLVALRQGLYHAREIAGLFAFSGMELPPVITRWLSELCAQDALIQLLVTALNDIVPLAARDGGFIREGYDATLDQYRHLCSHAEAAKLELRDRLRRETGITTLKIGENNILGLYIEVTSQHLAKIPEGFVHRQTMAGAVRYRTEELRELETKLIQAKERSLTLELQLFEALIGEVITQIDPLIRTAQALAQLDVWCAFAEVAVRRKYVRPVISEEVVLRIEKGRHPVVEALSEASFVPNDSQLEPGRRLWLMTGPNMGGKSTFLRQNALLVLMAQCGSFVPAEKAEIGIVDRLFSRVGAADDIARGQSTFMVEMVETAAILNQATPRSLVILDEIGRGTATYDGLSIAWAVVEYMHNINRSRCLFATHYHELTALATTLPDLANYTVRVKEWQEDIVFLHEVVPGAADRSYGIHVAKLAGLPQPVVVGAKRILTTIEQRNSTQVFADLVNDIPLFNTKNNSQNPANTSVSDDRKSIKYQEIIEGLMGANPDTLSPKEALDLVYKLKAILTNC